jgi:hypothetical protein
MTSTTVTITDEQGRDAVGALSVALGVLAVVAPRRTAKAFGVKGSSVPTYDVVPLLVRMIGVRNATMGLRTLQSEGDEQVRALKAGLAVGAVDGVAVLAAWRSGALSRRAAVCALALLAGIAALGVAAGRE